MEKKFGISKPWIKVSILINQFFSDEFFYLENVSKVDSRIFWASQYALGSLWLIFALASLLTFGLTNFVVCCISFTLSGINTWGYIKCDKEHQKKVGGFFYKRANSSLSTKQKAKLGMMAMSGSSGLGKPSPSSGM